MLQVSNKTKSPAEGKPQRADAAARKDSAEVNPLWQSLTLRSLALQRMAISQPDDPYEREADRVAEQVMRSTPPTSISAHTASLIAKRNEPGEEEEQRSRQKEQTGNPASLTAPPIVHQVGVPQIQRAIEVTPPGRGEATAFDRRDELIVRMNAVSPGTVFRLDGRLIRFNIVAGVAPTNFEVRMRDLITQVAVLRMRLITSAGTVGGGFIDVDFFDEGYVDLDDLLGHDDLSFQLNLVHLLVERASVRDYTRRIGTRFSDAEFARAHRTGIDAEAALLRDVIGDPTIRFNFDQTRNGTLVFAFRSDEGYRVFHVFRGGGQAQRHGEIFVRTQDGRRLTIDQLRAERAAARPPAVAPPAVAPGAVAPVPAGH